MRITNSMMVNNMLYWSGKQLEKLNDASNIVASGKQINKPSDDPSATEQILSDRATLSQDGQYESNITQAETWINTSSTTLTSVSSFLAEAQDIMSSISTADQTTSDGYLETMKNIYNQVLDLANSKSGSGYMYGGTDTISNTPPFSSTNYLYQYNGNHNTKTVIAGEGSSMTLNSDGSTIFSNALSVLSQAITAITAGNNSVDLTAAFDTATSTIEAEQVSLANTNTQLEYKNDRLKQLVSNASDRISNTEVGSTEEAAVKLQAQSTAYDVTLEAVAKVLKKTNLADLL